MKALTTLLVVGMFLTTVAMADDVDDVKAAVLEFYEQLNNENPSFTEYFLPGGSSFPRTGLFFVSFISLFNINLFILIGG